MPILLVYDKHHWEVLEYTGNFEIQEIREFLKNFWKGTKIGKMKNGILQVNEFPCDYD